ncbi:uncharacterized protein TNCV_4606601 [Trichonephila clavipes]|nr:uncharacterized protein TNCV_4606601 [Trichonephila clavipes]
MSCPRLKIFEVKEKYRRKISKLSTPEFKYVFKKAERSDSIEELVKDRILCAYDLIASEVKYHTLYNANFLNRLPSTEKKHRQDNRVSVAMAESFNYIENPDDSQFALKELRDVLTGRYGSERLIEMLHSLGFVASYGNTVQFEISTAYHPQPRILSSESGTLVQYFGDNVNILLMVRDDADVLIVETAIEESEHHTTAVIVGEDIDLLVILIERTQSHQEVFFKKINSSSSIPRRKLSCTNILHENGVRVLLAIYNAPQSENSIDNLRCTQFIKSTKLNKPVQLSNISPTRAAAHQHISRVYYQVQTWTTQPTSRIGTLTSTFAGLKEDTCTKDSLAADQR